MVDRTSKSSNLILVLCRTGVCECEAGYSGADCAVDVSTPPELIYIVGDTICDLRQGPCPDSLIIVGAGFANTANLSCHLTPLQVGLHFQVKWK